MIFCLFVCFQGKTSFRPYWPSSLFLHIVLLLFLEYLYSCVYGNKVMSELWVRKQGARAQKVCHNDKISNQPHILSLLGGWEVPQPCLKVPCSHCWMYYGLVQSLAKGRPHCCGSTFLGIVQYCVFRYCKGRSSTDHGYNTRWCGWILCGIFWKVSVTVLNLWGWGEQGVCGCL